MTRPPPIPGRAGIQPATSPFQAHTAQPCAPLREGGGASAPGGVLRTAVAPTLIFALPLLLLSACVRVTPPVTHSAPPPTSPSHPTPPPGILAPARPSPTIPPSPLPSSPEKPTANSSPVIRHPSLAFERTFALQLHLDQNRFSPGGIDGRWGTKSRNALAAWQLAHHLSPTGDPTDPNLPAALTSTNNLYTTHTVTPADHAALAPTPTGWREKAKRDRLGYATISELLCERYHLYEATLRHLNPDAPSWPNPPPGTILTVPASIPSPTSQKTRLPPLSRLEIRLADHTLRAYAKDGTLAAQFPCSIAADKTKRPVDRTLHVRVWAENPDYTFDPALYADDPSAAAIGKRLRIPPGPNNPVGLAWIGLDLPGYGIHGTPSPEDITKTESHGCFRLTNWDALRLVHSVHKDLPVKILP